MTAPMFLVVQTDLVSTWKMATPEGKMVIFVLVIVSTVAWSVMFSKFLLMRRAKKLNQLFDAEFRVQKRVLGVHERQIQVEGCPLFAVYREGCLELVGRLQNSPNETGKQHATLISMQHVKLPLKR